MNENKKYPYGRSHVVTNSSQSDDDDERIGSLFIENPRKVCKQCGKCFPSLKALCGHMASHSDKCFKDDDVSWTSDSDTQHEDRIIRTRSSKSKKLATRSGSSVSEIDVEEQEELAMCLMLLSRDSMVKCTEFSDNNSVILETKSSSIDTKTRKLDALALKNADKHHQDETHSDSDYFLDESGRSESGIDIRRKLFGTDQYKHSNGNTTGEAPQKRSKYECLNCKKIFKSYQALGGHKPCHKRSNEYSESRYETGENSPVVKKKATDLLDLNLPAPEEEEEEDGE